jgi:hypothetical protein
MSPFPFMINCVVYILTFAFVYSPQKAIIIILDFIEDHNCKGFTTLATMFFSFYNLFYGAANNFDSV